MGIIVNHGAPVGQFERKAEDPNVKKLRQQQVDKGEDEAFERKATRSFLEGDAEARKAQKLEGRFAAEGLTQEDLLPELIVGNEDLGYDTRMSPDEYLALRGAQTPEVKQAIRDSATRRLEAGRMQAEAGRLEGLLAQDSEAGVWEEGEVEEIRQAFALGAQGRHGGISLSQFLKARDKRIEERAEVEAAMLDFQTTHTWALNQIALEETSENPDFLKLQGMNKLTAKFNLNGPIRGNPAAFRRELLLTKMGDEDAAQWLNERDAMAAQEIADEKRRVQRLRQTRASELLAEFDNEASASTQGGPPPTKEPTRKKATPEQVEIMKAAWAADDEATIEKLASEADFDDDTMAQIRSEDAKRKEEPGVVDKAADWVKRDLGATGEQVKKVLEVDRKVSKDVADSAKRVDKDLANLGKRLKKNLDETGLPKVWKEGAERDVKAVLDYVYEDGPKKGIAALKRFMEGIKAVGTFDQSKKRGGGGPGFKPEGPPSKSNPAIDALHKGVDPELLASGKHKEELVKLSNDIASGAPKGFPKFTSEDLERFARHSWRLSDPQNVSWEDFREFLKGEK